MSITSNALLHGVLATGAGALLASTLAFSPLPASATPDCELTFEPHSVVAGGEALQLPYRASVEIDTPDAVTFQTESGLTGGLIEERPNHIRVDPSEGAEGEWVVTLLRAELPLCAGTLHVTESP